MAFWDNFGTQSASTVRCSNTSSVAVDVLTKFGLTVRGSAGGNLSDVDIKHMDALTAVKVSLLEDLAGSGSSKLKEVAVDTSGIAYFYQVGGSSGGVTDVYHTIQSAQHTEKVVGALVTGKDPLPVRKLRGWTDILAGSSEIFSVQDMTDNCNAENFARYATTIYKDPMLKSTYNDGIDNLYNVTDPFENIIGYAYKKNTPDFDNQTQLIHNSSTKIPVLVSTGGEGSGPNIGTLVAPSTVSTTGLLDPSCWTGIGTDAPGGVPVPLPSTLTYQAYGGTQINAFQGVVGVFFIGVRLDLIYTVPNSDSDALLNSPISGEVWVYADDSSYISYVLQEGKDYIVNYKSQTSVDLVFANNKHPKDPGSYGTNVKYRPHPLSVFSVGSTGEDGLPSEQTGTLFLFSHNQGMLVKEVWAIVDAQVPSITVYHPDGRNNKAKTILESMTYDIAAITVQDNPPPMSFNGNTINQSGSVKDNDPTSTQNFVDTAYEKVIDQMNSGGGGLTLTMSSLEQGEINRLSANLYEIMKAGSGTQTIYVCGPECNPQIGGTGPGGGIINNITYNYSDQGSYTISVTEGPEYIGNLTQIAGGPSLKQAESTSVKGTVVQDLGNHCDFKVRLDGMGERTAINCQKEILRVGDRVNCTIHNNPVEA